jgi:hypothetical protein
LLSVHKARASIENIGPFGCQPNCPIKVSKRWLFKAKNSESFRQPKMCVRRLRIESGSNREFFDRLGRAPLVEAIKTFLKRLVGKR